MVVRQRHAPDTNVGLGGSTSSQWRRPGTIAWPAWTATPQREPTVLPSNGVHRDDELEDAGLFDGGEERDPGSIRDGGDGRRRDRIDDESIGEPVSQGTSSMTRSVVDQ
jgi:hypothetical protein